MDSSCFFTFLLVFAAFPEHSFSLSYLKTEGKTQIIRESRIPERREVLSCLGVCERTPTCMCVRVSTNGDGTCQPINNTMDINGKNSTGYIYFAQALYENTVDKGSVALQKPAHQSSTYILNNVRYGAERAVDGNRNVDGFQAPYFSHTQDGDKAELFPWWQVDLEKEYIVTGVNILNRRKWADRLHDFEIRIGNNRLTSTYSHQHFTLNALCAQHPGDGIADATTVQFTCQPCLTRGRYVSIQIVRVCKTCVETNRNILQLAEVDVFGVEVVTEGTESPE